MRVRTIAAACVAAAAASLCVSATIHAAEPRPPATTHTAGTHEPDTALNASHSLVGCAGLIAAIVIYRTGRRR